LALRHLGAFAFMIFFGTAAIQIAVRVLAREPETDRLDGPAGWTMILPGLAREWLR